MSNENIAEIARRWHAATKAFYFRRADTPPVQVIRDADMIRRLTYSLVREAESRRIDGTALIHVAGNVEGATETRLDNAFALVKRLELGVASVGDDGRAIAPVQFSDPNEPYMPAKWYRDEFGLTADALRKQAERGKLPVRKLGYFNHYSFPKAREIWPSEIDHGPGMSA